MCNKTRKIRGIASSEFLTHHVCDITPTSLVKLETEFLTYHVCDITPTEAAANRDLLLTYHVCDITLH